MNQSEALYYPISYYKGIAACCADYMTRLFATDEVPYTPEQHGRWQERLEHFIERILLNARLDESAAIGTMILLENFLIGGAKRPTYPDESYFGYFMGAYMTATRVLTSSSRSTESPPSQKPGFWLDVIGGMFSQQAVQQMEFDFRSSLNADVSMSDELFHDMKTYMYAFVRLRVYIRTGKWSWPVEVLELPPCHDEMVKRKELFTSIRSQVPKLQRLSDRDFYRFLMRDRDHKFTSCDRPSSV